MSVFNYIWPVVLVILSNTFYHICAKSIPEKLNPFASFTITYSVAAAVSFILFLILGKGANLITEYAKLNWAPFILGVSIVGLEVGFLFAYKAGWMIGTLSIVTSAVLAAILLIVGLIGYHEPLGWKQITGIGISIAGIIFMNLK